MEGGEDGDRDDSWCNILIPLVRWPMLLGLVVGVRGVRPVLGQYRWGEYIGGEGAVPPPMVKGTDRANEPSNLAIGTTTTSVLPRLCELPPLSLTFSPSPYICLHRSHPIYTTPVPLSVHSPPWRNSGLPYFHSPIVECAAVFPLWVSVWSGRPSALVDCTLYVG